MQIIRPIAITDAMLTSSNVAETDKAEWDAATAYTPGDQRMVLAESKSGTVASNYNASHVASLFAGGAFFLAIGADLSRYAGTDNGDTPYKITLTDAAGKKATGYVGRGGGGENETSTVPTLGTEMALRGDMGRSTNWVVTSGGWTIASDVATAVNGREIENDQFQHAGQKLEQGKVYYSSMQVTARTSGSVALYYGASSNPGVSRSSAATFTECGTADRTTTNTETGFGATGFAAFNGSIDNLSCKEVLDPPKAANGGLHVVSSKNGTYRGWESIESGFDPMQIASYTITNDSIYHKVYECLVGNTGYFPPENISGATPKWLEIGATNRWKAFDGKIQDQASNASSIQYVLTPGSLDAIAFFGLDADTITLDLASGGISRYSATITLAGATEAVKTDIPSGYTAGVLTITISKSTTAKVGEIIMGLKYALGSTLLGPTVGITDYSIKEADQWGDYFITERAYSSRGDFEGNIANSLIDDAFETLAAYRATPLAFIGYSGYSSMILYGFYKDFVFTMMSPRWSSLSVSVEGLT